MTAASMAGPAPVRVAVVGVGHLGRHHARIASSLPGTCLAGVLDRNSQKATDVAREFGGRVLPDLDAVAQEADAVVVATPTVSHAEISCGLLGRGRDVLVEKPIASSLEEADRILAAASAAGRIVQVGHVERYNPAIEAALKLVRNPGFIEVHRLGVFTPRSLDVDVVLDLMIHDLQIVRVLAGGPAREVRAAGVPVLTRKVDIANARIAFEGGCVANLTASRVSTERVRKCRIFAPALYVSVDMQSQSLRALRLTGEGAEAKILPVEVEVPREEPLAREMADFARAVRDRAEPIVPGWVRRDALALACQVQDAIAEHGHQLGGGTP